MIVNEPTRIVRVYDAQNRELFEETFLGTFTGLYFLEQSIADRIKELEQLSNASEDEGAEYELALGDCAKAKEIVRHLAAGGKHEIDPCVTLEVVGVKLGSVHAYESHIIRIDHGPNIERP